MMDNTLILGAGIDKNNLKLSCCTKNQTELTNENYVLSDSYTEEEILLKLEGFLKKMEHKNDLQIVFFNDEQNISVLKNVEKRLLHSETECLDIRIISKEHAFIHYVLNQEESLRQYTVFLFEFDGTTLTAYRMAHSKKKMPLNYKAEKNVIGTFSLSGTSKEWGRIFDEKFAAIAKQILSKEVVSAVYLTGEGFEGGWLKKSLNILCEGRRAFIGQNLFSSGCCYYGRSCNEKENKDFMIQAPETVLYESGVLDGANKDAFVQITEAGNAWYETKGTVDVIMERAGKVDVVFVNAMTKEKQVETVDISALSERPRKIGRLRIGVQFFDSISGVIMVCDQGFGEFLPATYQVFLKEFSLI